MQQHYQIPGTILFSLLLLVSGRLYATSEFDEYMLQQQDATTQYSQQQMDEFARHQAEMDEGFRQFQQIYQEEFKAYSDTLAKHWAQPKVSSSHQWVSYYRQGTLRQTVDFENARITLELQQLKSPNTEQLTQLIEQQLLALLKATEADAFKADLLSQSIESRITREVKHVLQGTPGNHLILTPLFPDVATADDNELARITKQLARKATIQLTQEGHDATPSLLIEIQLDNNRENSAEAFIAEPSSIKALSYSSFNPAWLRKVKTTPVNKRSHHYQPLAKQSAEKEKLPTALVLAIMETESSFNPMAKSHVPAYGLMQVVPRSAGRDATAYLFGKSKILAPSYLYNSDNNITIGSAYLHQLNYRYMRFIKDPQSRLYCTIAAYNTGPGNVARAFSDSISIRKVAPLINKMSAEQVYEQLQTQLPHEETQNYLRKVTARMENYSE